MLLAASIFSAHYSLPSPGWRRGGKPQGGGGSATTTSPFLTPYKYASIGLSDYYEMEENIIDLNRAVYVVKYSHLHTTSTKNGMSPNNIVLHVIVV